MAGPPLISDPQKVDADWLTAAVHAAGRAGGARVRSVRRDFVGTGQMGRNVRFTMEWEGEAEDAPRALVGKFPSDNPTSRATGAMHGSYRKEVRFYQEVVDTVDIRTPRCWLALIDDNDADFVLLMEDVSPAEQGDQIAGCGVDEAALALEELAKLHAPRWGDPRLHDLDFLQTPDSDSAKLLRAIYTTVWPGFAERYGSRLAPESLALGERLGPRLEEWSSGFASPLTVTHGDYRLDNMLFGKGEGAPPLAVVDWQTVAHGVGAGDAAYFIGAGLGVELRREVEQLLIRSYWEQLSARGVTGYDFDQCWQDYRRSTFGGVVMAVVASMIVEQTDRGDEMFLAMMSRHSQHAIDLESESLL